MRKSRGTLSPWLMYAALLSACIGNARAADAGADPDTSSPPLGDWGGFYGGMNAGYDFGNTSSTLNFINSAKVAPEPPASPSSYHLAREGFSAGIQLGYNYVADDFLLGVEPSISIGNYSGTATIAGVDSVNHLAFTSTQKASLDWVSSLDAKAGMFISPPVLLYVLGGLALAGTDHSGNLTFSGTGTAYTGARWQTEPGWTLGAGTEIALGGGPRLFAEYRYTAMDSGTVNGYQQSLSNFHTQSDFRDVSRLLRVGINYPLGSGDAPNDQSEPALGSLLSIFDGINFDFGTRYWYSVGSMKYILYNLAGTSVNSRLHYGFHTQTGELFGTVEHPSGLYAKWNLGLGAAMGGSLSDEDFPPFESVYSKTISTQRDGQIKYATFDLGYAKDFGGIKIGPFAGYNSYEADQNAYGCNQVATNTGICTSVSPSALDISQNAQWTFATVGIGNRIMTPWYGLEIDADAAWVPYGGLSGTDTHWLRLHIPDPASGQSLSGPQSQSGVVRGAQFEALARLPLDSGISVDLGGRYWDLYSHGSTEFFHTFGDSSQQPTRFSTSTYGVFLDVSVAVGS